MKLKIVLFLMLTMAPMQGNAQPKPQDTSDIVWSVLDNNYISSLQFSPDDSKILTIGDGGTIIFDTQTGTQLKQLPGTGLYYPDGTSIIFPTVAQDSSGISHFAIDFFDANIYEKTKTLLVPSLVGSYAITISADGKTIAAVRENELNFIDFQTGTVLKKMTTFANETRKVFIGGFLFTKDGQYLIITLYDPVKGSYGEIMFINRQTYNIDYSTNIGWWTLRLSEDGNMLAFRSNETGKAVTIMNTQTHQIIGQIPGFATRIVSMSFSPDGQYIAVSTEDNYLKLYHLPDLTIKKTIYFAPFDGLDITKNNEYIAGAASVVLFRFLPTGVPEQKYIPNILFPNPADNTITISLNIPISTNLTINIYDLSGKLISKLKEQFYNTGQITDSLYIGNLPNGNYFLKLESLRFNKTFKIIINK